MKLKFIEEFIDTIINVKRILTEARDAYEAEMKRREEEEKYR